MPTEQTQNDETSGRFANWPLLFVFMIVFGFLLLAMVNPNMFSHRGGHSGSKSVQADFSTLAQALDLFNVDNGHYPTGTNALQALMTAPVGATNWHQYLGFIPQDPWRHAYVYECPGKHRTNSYDLFSMGPDGRAGTGDDIVNWNTKN